MNGNHEEKDVIEGEPMTNTKEIAVYEQPRNAVINWSDAVNLASTARKMRQSLAKDVLVEGNDYGKPFEGAPKPVLLLPGAQKITDAFECYAEPVLLEKIEQWDRKNPLFYYHYQVKLRQRGTNAIISIGEGSANSNESKWYWREGKRKCPKCGKETIFKSKQSGWYCWAKKGGCGAQFPNDSEPQIINQNIDRVPNEDIFDQVNTIKKIAIKRAHVAAAVNFGFSELFTQDLDDFTPPEYQGREEHSQTKKQAPPAQSKAKKDNGITEPPSNAQSAGFIPANDEEKKEAESMFAKLCAIVDSKVFEKKQSEALLKCWKNYTTIAELRNYFQKAESAYNAKLEELRKQHGEKKAA